MLQKKRLRDLYVKMVEGTDDCENVLHENMNESLIGITLLMRNVTEKAIDNWDFRGGFPKSNHIKTLCNKKVEEMQDKVNNNPNAKKNEFFFPRTDDEREIFVKDMQRCYDALTGVPNSNLLAISFENIDVGLENSNVFKILYVNHDKMDVNHNNNMDVDDDDDDDDNSDLDDENSY